MVEQPTISVLFRKQQSGIMSIRISLAGVTGWSGSALALAIAQSNDITLVSAVSRTHAQHFLSEVLDEPRLNCPVYATAREALALPCAEIIFGMPDQKLTIRHDSGSSGQPYVDGALLAIRKVNTFVGQRRGLDRVLDL